MKFLNWLESIEFQKPSGKIVRKNITKDPGTNVARKIIEYRFKTKLGNEIKLQFEPKGNNEYNVMFYTNDTLYDFAPKIGMDLKPEKYQRDTEILPAVFHLLKMKADQLKANTLTFQAYSSPGDIKTVRGLDIKKPKQEALEILNHFENIIKNHKIQFIEPNKELYKRLNKPIPEPKADLDKDFWINFLNKLRIEIENDSQNSLDDRLLTAIELHKSSIDFRVRLNMEIYPIPHPFHAFETLNSE